VQGFSLLAPQVNKDLQTGIMLKKKKKKNEYIIVQLVTEPIYMITIVEFVN